MMRLFAQDRWIPASFIMFFIALFALEVWFISLAIRTDPGLVTDPPRAGATK